MTSRRVAVLALLSLPMGYWRAWAKSHDPIPTDPGSLLINLNQWDGLAVQYKGEVITLTSAEVFEALAEAPAYMREPL